MSGGEVAKTSKDNEDWFVACSDEEVYRQEGCVRGKMSDWRPNPEETLRLLQTLDQSGPEALKLEWQCGGRRPPTPSTESEYSDSDDEAARLEAAKAAKDFDFADEDEPKTPLASRRPGSAQRELKGSARKKTTDLKSILSSMERHRKMDEAGKQPSTPTTTMSSK